MISLEKKHSLLIIIIFTCLPYFFLRGIFHDGIIFNNDHSLDILFKNFSRLSLSDSYFGTKFDNTDLFNPIFLIFTSLLKLITNHIIFSKILICLPVFVFIFTIFYNHHNKNITNLHIIQSVFFLTGILYSSIVLTYDSNYNVQMSVFAFAAILINKKRNFFLKLILVDFASLYLQFLPVYLIILLLINFFEKKNIKKIFSETECLIIFYMIWIILNTIIKSEMGPSVGSLETFRMFKENIGMARVVSSLFSNLPLIISGFPLFSNVEFGGYISFFGIKVTLLLSTIIVLLKLSIIKNSNHKNILIFICCGLLILSVGPFDQFNINYLLFKFFPFFHVFRSYFKFNLMFIVCLSYFIYLNCNNKKILISLIFLKIFLFYNLINTPHYQVNFSKYNIPKEYFYELKRGHYFLLNQSSFQTMYKFRKIDKKNNLSTDTENLLMLNNKIKLFATGASYSKLGFNENMNFTGLALSKLNHTEPFFRSIGIDYLLFDKNIFIAKHLLKRNFEFKFKDFEETESFYIKNLHNLDKKNLCIFETDIKLNKYLNKFNISLNLQILNHLKQKGCSDYFLFYKENLSSNKIIERLYIKGLDVYLPYTYGETLRQPGISKPNLNFISDVNDWKFSTLNIKDKYNLNLGKIKTLCFNQKCFILNNNFNFNNFKNVKKIYNNFYVDHETKDIIIKYSIIDFVIIYSFCILIIFKLYGRFISS